MEYHYVLTDPGTEELDPDASSVADQESTGEQLSGSKVNSASNGNMDDIENNRNNLILESSCIVVKGKMPDNCTGIESNTVDYERTGSNNDMIGNDCLAKSDNMNDHGDISPGGELNNKLKNGEADSEEFDLAKVKSENTNEDAIYGTSTEHEDYNLDADTEPEDDVTGDIFRHSRSKNAEENHIEDVASEDINQENIKPEIDPDTQVIVLNKHNKFNARPKPDPSILRHECDKCDYAFQFPYQLARHKNIKHEGKYPYYCHVCNKPFDRSSSLRDHMYVHTDSRPFECKQCDKSFKMKGNLRKHIRDMHTEVEGPKLKFQCEYCSKIFPTKERLTSHFLVHDTEKPFACNICGKRFNRKNNLKEHIVIHSTEKNFVCPDCGMRFNRKYSLKIHARNHMAVKPYKCELCPSSFSQLHALKTHFRLHTGEKPFKCTICEKTFRQLATLQVHFKRHTGVKDFKCGICGKGFVIKRRLIEHERLHTGEKPFSCDLCPYRAATSSGLRLHKKTHMRQMQRLAMQKAEGVVNEGGEKTDISKKKRNVTKKTRLSPLTVSAKFLKKKLNVANDSEDAISSDDKDGNVESVQEDEMNHVVNGEIEMEETNNELNECLTNESIIEIVNDVADVEMYSADTSADSQDAINENLSSINVNYSEASMNLEVPQPEVQYSEVETKSKSLKKPSKVSNKKAKAKEDEFENSTKEILYKHLNEFIPVIDADVLAEKIDLITEELFKVHSKPATRKTVSASTKKSKKKSESEIFVKNGSLLTDSSNISNSLNVTNPIVVQGPVSESSDMCTFGTQTKLDNDALKKGTKSIIQQKNSTINPNVNPFSNQTIIRQLLSTTKPQNTFPSNLNTANRGVLLQSHSNMSNQEVDKQGQPFLSTTLRNMLLSKNPDYITKQNVTMATAHLSVKKENTASASTASSLAGSSAVLRDMLSTPPKHYLISTKNSYAAFQRSIKRQNVLTPSQNGFQGQWYTAGKPEVESDFPWVEESEPQSSPKTDISISHIKMEPMSP